MELKSFLNFEVKNDLLIGTIRGDFNDSPNRIYHSFTPAPDAINNLKFIPSEINSICNPLLRDTISSWSKLVLLCKGEGYSWEANYYTESDNYNYWIRLIPVMGDYNLYIKIYAKEGFDANGENQA